MVRFMPNPKPTLEQMAGAKFPPRSVKRLITAKEAVADTHKRFPKIMAALAKAEAEERNA